MLALSPVQRYFMKNSDKRANIIVGSVRSGKTIVNIHRWSTYIGREAPKGDLLIIGKTGRAIYRNIVRPMEDLYGDEVQYFPGKGELSMFGRTHFIVGANDERSEGIIRGMTAAGALGDEVTLWPESFYTMLMSRLSVANAKLFGSTNTDNPRHWFKKKYVDRAHLLNMRMFKFLIDDNEFLDPQFVKDIKKEYVGLWYKRYIKSEWSVAEGAVYDFFDESLHTLPRNRLPKADYYIVAMDYGTGNPTCFLLFGVNKSSHPKIWCEKEFYYDSKKEERQKTDGEYSVDYKKWIGKIPVRSIYVDPSAASFKAQLKADGVFNVKDADNTVIDGIRVQASMLKNGDYAICDECVNVIEDYSGYIWDNKAQLRGEDKPLKQNDHTKDPERYALYTEFGSPGLDYEKATEW
jgi:PBSX family phage terminase large subunit